MPANRLMAAPALLLAAWAPQQKKAKPEDGSKPTIGGGGTGMVRTRCPDGAS